MAGNIFCMQNLFDKIRTRKKKNSVCSKTLNEDLKT